jgi:hypothetical protein
MDDLDQLAATAGGADPSSTTRSQSPRRAPPRRGKPTNPAVVWACAGGGLLLLLVVVLVALNGGGSAGGRKFSAAFHEEAGQFGAWEVTNEGDTPLRISGVTVNREYSCEPAAGPGRYGDSFSPAAYPVTVAAGQTWAFSQYRPSAGGGKRLFDLEGPKGYATKPAYVEFLTDRGTFRYRPDRGWE